MLLQFATVAGRPAKRWLPAAPLVWCLGAALAVSANDACAAALGSLVTSVGLFAALAALFLVKGWPAQLPVSALPTAGGALIVAGGAAWLWRAGAAGRWRGAVGLQRHRDARAEGAGGRSPPAASVSLPIGVDRDALLADMRRHFLQLQEAWDLGATPILQTLTTADMLAELRLGLPACVNAVGKCRTEVVTLRAELFAFEELAGVFLASVEFSGLMRESANQCAEPFRELWMLTKSKDDGAGWKLARHQALL